MKTTTNLINWIVNHLIANDRFRSYIMSLCKEYYTSDSLRQVRVWGEMSRLVVGNNVHLNNALINTVSGYVYVGDDTFFGHHVSLLTGTHNYRKYGVARQTDVPAEGRDIVVGKGVWIASNATIIGPCRIGDNAVITAGSIVTGNVNADALYSGIPAKMIRII